MLEAERELTDHLDHGGSGVYRESWKMPGKYRIVGWYSSPPRDHTPFGIEPVDFIDVKERLPVRDDFLNIVLGKTYLFRQDGRIAQRFPAICFQEPRIIDPVHGSVTLSNRRR